MDLIAAYRREYQGTFEGPISAEEVDSLLNHHGVRDSTYRDWLIQTGGGPVGPDWFDTIGELPVSQRKLREDGWTLAGFVIGWDGGGNPIAIQADGRLLVEDHAFGGTHVYAESFRSHLEANVSS